MLFERFEDAGLAQYSYAVGCPGAGQVAIVDPRRDIDVYLSFAASQGLAITHVLETHIHADFASGARRLAQVTGAELWLSAYDRGEHYEVAFDHRPTEEGDTIQLGAVRLEALHTPGHTPEHLSFLVFDDQRSREVPMLLLSGDFLFVGSLGRPDLLGEDAKQELAERLFDSVRHKLAPLPDSLEIHPGHGAGSMCGAGMSGRPTSTLGYERAANPYLDPTLTKADFVGRILDSVPPFPPYYRRMKEVNSLGARSLGELPGRNPISAAELQSRIQDVVVLDLRDQLAWGGGHIPGSFGIGASPSLSVWASWAVPYDTPIVLVTDDVGQIEAAIRGLVRVGLDQIDGWLKGGIEAWVEAGGSLAEVHQAAPEEIARRRDSGEKILVVDVRGPVELLAGKVPDSFPIPVHEIDQRAAELPLDQPVAVICRSGHRSTFAASLLERLGRENVINVVGGMNAWQAAGLPIHVETEVT